MLARDMGTLPDQPSLPFGDPPARHERSERLMSVQELADYLDVPVKTIYAWRYHGHGPRGFKVGRHVSFRWRDVQVWLSDQIAGKG